MYIIDKHDRVHELTDVPFPSSSAPAPLVLADEDPLVVACVTAKPPAGEAGGAGLPSANEPAVMVVFRRCYAGHFGPPNDESFASHPLADRGLRPYGAI